MRNLKKIFMGSFLSVAAVSCSFLDTEPNVIEAGTYYNSASELQYGLAGVYGALNNEASYGNYYSLMLSNIDDLSYFNRNTSQNLSQLLAHDASATEIYQAWIEFYAGIKNANAFMEAIADSEFDTNHQYWNEARFLRAYYHFILAQAWGDVPLKDAATLSPNDVNWPASSQLEVLKWSASEMEQCLYSYVKPESEEDSDEEEDSKAGTKVDIPSDPSAEDPALKTILAEQDLSVAPSRIVPSTMCGILARVYLFMAGESIDGTTPDMKHEYFGKAMKYSKAVIDCGRHKLNQSYSQIFINMIQDKYDNEYYESMWEVEFLGDRSGPSAWTNGRIGDLIGLQSTGEDTDFGKWACNYSYAQYNGSLKLFDLYYKVDRTDEDVAKMATFKAGDDLTLDNIAEKYAWDKRQAWNMCPYNYNGNDHVPAYPDPSPYAQNAYKGKTLRSYSKTPYVANKESTSQKADIVKGLRNAGKWRREVQYEGQGKAKDLYTTINFPILRYADVLLMYAEAYNEYIGSPTQDVYQYVVEIRNRAGISTKPFSEYASQEAFREFVHNERGRELVFEALRKYDLIRWGTFVSDIRNAYTQGPLSEEWPSGNNTATLSAQTIGQNVQERHILLPIPSIELGVNTSLKQNKYW